MGDARTCGPAFARSLGADASIGTASRSRRGRFEAQALRSRRTENRPTVLSFDEGAHDMQRRILLFTGLAGLAGGLTTLALGSSCDAECIREDRPSVIAHILSIEGGVTRPVTASAVTYDFLGHARSPDSADGSFTARPLRDRGYCLDSACTTWALGVDQAGLFDIEVEACGQTLSQRVDVAFDEDACHAETEEIAVVVDCDEPRPVVAQPTCDAGARPSVFVYVAREHDDYLEAVPVERVWYEHEGRVADASCAGVDIDGECPVWIAGWELEGRFRIFTEWCDTIVSETVAVGMTEDGCHVATEFVVLPVSTRGCITTEPGPENPGDPTGPREAHG
jgi:hypothetical protein